MNNLFYNKLMNEIIENKSYFKYSLYNYKYDDEIRKKLINN